MKSITQVAEELKVSNKTIQRYIKRLNITTEKQGTERLIDDDAIKRIGQAIQDNKTGQQDNLNSEIQHGEAGQDNRTTRQQDNKTGQRDSIETYKIKAEMLQSQLEHMHSEITFLNGQLQVKDNQLIAKDNQLNIKDKQIEQHLQTIQALTGQIDRLTTQIETAHQLNAGNIKALLNEQSKSDAEEQQPQKQGFFARLFRRKNR